MTEEQKRKLAELRSANNEYKKRLQWKNNVLLQDCLKALGKYQLVGDETEISRILNTAKDTNITSCCTAKNIIDNHIYYVVWDNEQVPIIECCGADILAHWDDVLAVAFDTCFIDKNGHGAILIKG